MRTWLNRKSNDILLRKPTLVVQTGQGNTRPLHTVVAQETGDQGAPIHTAVAIFTDPQEASGYRRKATEFAGRVKLPKGAK